MHRIFFALGLCVLLLACPRVEGQTRPKAHVRLLRHNTPAAARVSITGNDGNPSAPSGAAIRKTKRGESYFYADGSFDVELPPGRVRMTVSGGLETIPQTVTLDAEAATELTVPMQHWVDMAARGWYSGDSHVHLHTGGPIDVTVAGRAGRRAGGGGPLRQSLRVEQRRRRHPRRGDDHRQAARGLDGPASPGLRRGDEELPSTATCSSSESRDWSSRNTPASTRRRTGSTSPRTT